MLKRNQLILVVALGLSLASCGGEESVRGANAANGVTASGLSGESTMSGSALGGVGAAGANGSLAGASMEELLSINTVYFAYDSALVDAQSQRIVEAHSQYLIEHPGVTVVLEGHTDERGTREYNLALGERRAKAIAQIMANYGVAPSRIQTVSYGEERPAVMGTGESVWRQNRRVVILR